MKSREVLGEAPKDEIIHDCSFCEMFVNPAEERIRVADSGQAAMFMSKKDGHPLVVPYQHVVGDETDRNSYFAIQEAWEWANLTFPEIRQAYEELYGATGFTIKANIGSQQNIKHYHIHIEAWKGAKDQDQIVITGAQEKSAFAQKVRDLMDPEGLTEMPLQPTHW